VADGQLPRRADEVPASGGPRAQALRTFLVAMVASATITTSSSSFFMRRW
jgi:hypothetical protein